MSTQNDEDIIWIHRNMEPSEIISQHQQASAWIKITKVLDEVCPGWKHGPRGMSGYELAEQAIRNLNAANTEAWLRCKELVAKEWEYV